MDSEAKAKAELKNETYTLKSQTKDLKKELSKSKNHVKSTSKEQNETFRETFQNFKTIFGHLNQPFVMQDMSGEILISSNGAEQILGLNKASNPITIIPTWKAIRRDGSLFPAEQHPAVVTFKTGKKCLNVIIGVHKTDGSLIWISVNSVPVKKDKQKAVYGILTSFTDISKSINSEKELAKSEEKLKIISTISSDYIYSVNPKDLSLEWVSGAFQEISGYTMAEVNKMPQKWVSIIHPDDAKAVSEKVTKDIEKQKSTSYDIRIIRRDGKIRWINDKISAVYENDKPVRIYGSVKDITEHKQSEEILLESEKQLSVIFDNSSDLQMLFSVGMDSDFRVVNVNKTCINYLKKIHKDIDESSFLGKNIYDVFSKTFKIKPDKYDFILGNFFQTIATSKQHEYYLSYGYNKEEYHSEVVLTPIYSKEGVCIYIHWASRDVTFRYNTLNALRESEAKYRELIEKSGDAIFLLFNNNLELTNSRFRELFGYSQKEITSKDFKLLELISPKSKKYIFDQYQKHQKEEKSESKFQFYGLTKDRKEIILEAAVGEIDYKDGKAIQGILRDISERTRMEEELRQSQKMDAIGRLAGGIAHDFNNLLTIINGYCELLLMRSISPDIQKPLQGILEAGSRATSLTSQLLAFSRKQVIKPMIINLNDLIQRQIKLLQRLIGENIDTKMNLNENLYNIRADPGQIEQIIMNITINARDAMPNGGVLTISTDNSVFDKNDVLELPGAKTGKYVKLSIKDSGIGMDEETLSRVFEPFFSTKARDKGTGLGLATVYGIIKQNNGFIYVESKPKFGTTFKVYLPFVKQKKSKQVAEKPGEDLHGHETILLVEDDISVREVTQTTLEGYGYNVIIASNGKEARQLFRKHNNRIKLLLTDVVMPVMNGKDLADKLCEINPELKVIFFSGYLDNAVLENSIKDKPIEYLQKPYTHFQLAKKVKRVLSA
jgi:PAS domain S-box-containing protein